MAEMNQRVLYIEDEPDMIDLVRLMLKDQNIEIIGANGGRQGLELAGQSHPDLVLLDLMMPDMDGWEVYRHLRASTTTHDIPVVVITARAQTIDKVFGLQVARVEDYLTKPFTPQELIACIQKILRKN